MRIAVSRTSSASRPRGASMKSKERSIPSASTKVTVPVIGEGSWGDGIITSAPEEPRRAPRGVCRTLEVDVLARHDADLPLGLREPALQNASACPPTRTTWADSVKGLRRPRTRSISSVRRGGLASCMLRPNDEMRSGRCARWPRTERGSRSRASRPSWSSDPAQRQRAIRSPRGSFRPGAGIRQRYVSSSLQRCQLRLNYTNARRPSRRGLLVRQLCASSARNQPATAGDNRMNFALASRNLALRLARRTSLLPVVTPEAPRLPGGAFSVVRALESQMRGSRPTAPDPRQGAQTCPCHSPCHSHAICHRAGRPLLRGIRWRP